MILFNRKATRDVAKREAYVIVTLGWVVLSLFGTLPFILSGSIPNFTDAFFETMSGFTTTGASVLNDIEALPHGVLFWRSMTQWIGGMGIIVLSIAILPLIKVGGMQMFAAEVPARQRINYILRSMKPRENSGSCILDLPLRKLFC